MEEEIKKSLKESLSSAFDKWANQYYQKHIDNEGRIPKKIIEEIRQEDLFLSKRVFILGFKRYVTQQVLLNPVLTKQKSVVLRAILKSIIYEHGITVKELEKDAWSDELYTRRHTQRLIHEIYSEVFVEMENQHKDERLKSHSTIFSPHTEFYALEKLPEDLAKAIYYIPNTSRNQKWVKINARIGTITPEYLRGLLEFRKEALSIMIEICFDTETGIVLYQELSKVSNILQIFHDQLQSIIAVMWWRSRREKTKRKLIQDGFQWKYTDKDAEKALESLLKLTESKEHTFNVMFDSSVAMIETNLHGSAEKVLREAVKLGEGPSLLIGIAHENLGVYHRQKNRSKLMIQEMKEAVEWYRKSGDDYRISVGLKNLAEAEWMYGYQETAIKYYREAEEMANILDREDKANAFGNLAVSAMRIGNRKMEIEYLSKYIVTCPDDWTERILNADKRLSELTR